MGALSFQPLGATASYSYVLKLFLTIFFSGHIFVQQSGHPSFVALCRLDNCMTKVYNKNQAPEIPRNEVVVGLVCVVPCDNKWYRVQVRISK